MRLVRWKVGPWHLQDRVTTPFLASDSGVTKTVTRPACEGLPAFHRFAEATDGTPDDQRDVVNLEDVHFAVCGGCREIVKLQEKCDELEQRERVSR